jgi:dehydrogenase/reductase SDR family protein 1
VYCDHADEKDIKALFDKIAADNNGQLDILVNNAYAAVNVRSVRVFDRI